MNNRWIFLLLAAMPFAAVAGEMESKTRGDVLVIEEMPPAEAQAPRPDVEVPARGMDMQNVRSVFGEPLEMHAAVGEPPITRWDYRDYSVFFEFDKVIHSVITE